VAKRVLQPLLPGPRVMMFLPPAQFNSALFSFLRLPNLLRMIPNQFLDLHHYGMSIHGSVSKTSMENLLHQRSYEVVLNSHTVMQVPKCEQS
jgi:hypothetical protein